jgi:hypothetical protein
MICTAALALAPAVLLAGCGTKTAPTADPTPVRSSATPSRTPTATLTPTPTVTPTPTPTQKPRPKPKDGTDLSACEDGRCEVLLTKPVTIALDGRLGVPQLDVTKVGPDGVDFSVVMPDGMQAGMYDQRPDQGGPSTLNKLRVYVIWLGKDSAVIRLAPAKS